jgi:uncharacterized protein (DUF58 family)
VENFRKYLDPQTLAKLSGLELRARSIVEGYVAGAHRSPFHGFSVEFAEHREYVPGDDLRYVDWKAFGKTDRVYLKQYEEETNLVCYLLLDVSESMTYRSDGAALSKLDYARCVAASLAYLVLQQQDGVGLTTFDAEVRAMIRPSTHPTHLGAMLHALETPPTTAKTSLGPIFHDLAERFKKRGVVVILSDLFDDPASLIAGLKHLRHRRHEVVLFHVIDPAEEEFPFRDLTLFKGLEGLPQELVDPAALRKAYVQEFEHFVREVKNGCHARQIDYVPLRTDRPLDLALSTYLAARRSRMN